MADEQKSGQGGELQAVRIERQGKPYWFELNPPIVQKAT